MHRDRVISYPFDLDRMTIKLLTFPGVPGKHPVEESNPARQVLEARLRPAPRIGVREGFVRAPDPIQRPLCGTHYGVTAPFR
jgi:hypothetical protein